MKRVKELMSLDVHPADPDESVADAAAKMRAWDVGFMPVCQDDAVAGVLTDRDIAVRVLAVGRDPATVAVREVMSWGAVCVCENHELRDAAALMKMRQIRRLPVVDHAGRLVGLFSISMIAKAEQERLAGEVLRRVVDREAS